MRVFFVTARHKQERGMRGKKPPFVVALIHFELRQCSSCFGSIDHAPTADLVQKQLVHSPFSIVACYDASTNSRGWRDEHVMGLMFWRAACVLTPP